MNFLRTLERITKKRYQVITVYLNDPSRVTTNYVIGDTLYIADTNADLTKVWISIDNEDWIRLDSIAGGLELIPPEYFNKLNIKWDASQDGKYITFIVGGESKARISQQAITLYKDLIGIAKEITLSGIKSQIDKLVFDSTNNLKVDLANTEIILPIEKQSNYKSYFTIYSGTVTANGNTSDIDAGIYSGLEIMLKVTAVSGTSPSLDLYIEGKFEATGDYKPLVYQTGITGTGIWYFTITQLIFKYIRARWVIGGTSPSFTIGVYAQGLV